VSAHDDLKEVFPGLLGQLLNAHVIDYQQIDFEIAVHSFDTVAEVLTLDQFGDGIKD